MFHQGSLQIKITQASGKFEYPGKQRLNQDLKPEKSLRGGSMDQGWEELSVRRWYRSGVGGVSSEEVVWIRGGRS